MRHAGRRAEKGEGIREAFVLLVLAANAPRRYSRLAYKEGLDALEALPPAEHHHFDFPLPVDDANYRGAFAREAAAHEGVTPQMVESTYAGQQIWDATMAASVVRALNTNGKIILTVGRFHVEHPGGLTAQLLARDPALATITLLPLPKEDIVTLLYFVTRNDACVTEIKGRCGGGHH